MKQKHLQGHFASEYAIVLVCSLLPLLGIQMCTATPFEKPVLKQVQEGIDKREQQTKNILLNAIVDPFVDEGGR
ncbi:MAG: hypothetical protein KDD46_07125 [Bdellovibrionales bacterium]|nr:hypothetical protein [Bdellovibrionales bacterium]